MIAAVTINYQEYVEHSNENQHIFSFDIAGGVNRFLHPEISYSYIGAPIIKSKFNISTAINVNYILKTKSKINFGGSIGFTRIGSREVWDYDSLEVLAEDYYLDILPIRFGANVFKKNGIFRWKQV
jgi:hypothetical protein